MTEQEAIDIIFTVRRKLGRCYKAEIRYAWMNGDYITAGLEAFDSDLQRIRNQFGPTWLHRLRLADDSTTSAY